MAILWWAVFTCLLVNILDLYPPHQRILEVLLLLFLLFGSRNSSVFEVCCFLNTHLARPIWPLSRSVFHRIIKALENVSIRQKPYAIF